MSTLSAAERDALCRKMGHVRQPWQLILRGEVHRRYLCSRCGRTRPAPRGLVWDRCPHCQRIVPEGVLHGGAA